MESTCHIASYQVIFMKLKTKQPAFYAFIISKQTLEINIVLGDSSPEGLASYWRIEILSQQEWMLLILVNSCQYGKQKWWQHLSYKCVLCFC